MASKQNHGAWLLGSSQTTTNCQGEMQSHPALTKPINFQFLVYSSFVIVGGDDSILCVSTQLSTNTPVFSWFNAWTHLYLPGLLERFSSPESHCCKELIWCVLNKYYRISALTSQCRKWLLDITWNRWYCNWKYTAASERHAALESTGFLQMSVMFLVRNFSFLNTLLK